MFKGYIPTKGKRPLEKVRGRDKFYELKDVENLHEYGGVLSDDYVMVDVDDSEEAEILNNIVNDMNLKCNKLKTSRGRHFYFKNTTLGKNCIDKLTSIGIHVDIKLGSKNAVVPLKLDGKVRKIEMVADVEDLPRWLNVIPKAPNFFNLGEGDGRNQILFNYILTMQHYGFNKYEIIDTFKIINTYILSDPLDEKELETILRDEAFDKPNFYNDKGTLQHDKFAKFLKSECLIIKINGILHIYKDGVYIPSMIEIEKAMIKYIPILTKAKRGEIMAYLDLIAEEKKLSDSNLLVFNNGLFDIEKHELLEFDVNYIAKNKIAVDYNPAAYSEVMDKTLNKIACHDRELRLLIEEMIGYTLLRRNQLGKCFILTGQGSNGKSTLLDVIKELIGQDNISSVGLNELNQRFKTAELYGKLVNIGDDISNNYIEDNSTFKKLVTGETVNVERKGKDPFDFNNYSKLIFSANELPRINDTSNGLMRRLVIVPFNAKFSSKDEDFDPFIIDKLKSPEALQYLLNIAIEGLKRILNTRKLTEVQAVEGEIKEYEKINNPVVAYMEEFKIENEPVNDVYLAYATWCIDSGLKKLSKIQFGRELKKRGYSSKGKTINGKTIRVYVKGEIKND